MHGKMGEKHPLTYPKIYSTFFFDVLSIELFQGRNYQHASDFIFQCNNFKDDGKKNSTEAPLSQ